MFPFLLIAVVGNKLVEYFMTCNMFFQTHYTFLFLEMLLSNRTNQSFTWDKNDTTAVVISALATHFAERH